MTKRRSDLATGLRLALNDEVLDKAYDAHIEAAASAQWLPGQPSETEFKAVGFAAARDAHCSMRWRRCRMKPSAGSSSGRAEA